MPSCLSAGPSNIRVLMDSNNYATLLGPGGVWTAADLDGSGTTVSYEPSYFSHTACLKHIRF